MLNIKRGASSPPNKEKKKQKEEDCLICSEVATEDVLECVWCDGRVHSKCVKISEEQIILLGNVRNVLFFCNTCLNTLPIALKYFEDLSPMDSRITAVEKSIAEIQSTGNQVNNEVHQFSKQNQEVANQISSLTTEINQLVSNNNKMQSHIENMKATMHTESTNWASATPGMANSLDIVDEMADRDRRKCNLVVYNFVESDDKGKDIELFQGLCSDVFKLEVKIIKATRLGPKIPNKQRPLLLSVEDIDDKIYLLSHSHFLRKNDSYSNIYIAPDRTKLERAKHRKLVEELKDRRSKGETSLVIRNGTIVQKQPNCNNSAKGSDAQNPQSTTQSS